MKTIEIIIAFVFGTIWGSFFYTIVLRYSSGAIKKNPLKALFSSSKCPCCNKSINPFFLVPILGYIFQKGKCRKCGAKISLFYPISEIVYGLLLIIIACKYGVTFYSFNVFLLTGLVIAISIIDIKTLTIPDSLVIAFVILSIYPVVLNDSFKDNLLGLLLMFIFFVLILLIFPGSFGGGDVKFASSIGFLFGFELSIVILETALISGALIGIIYALKTKKSLRTKIPFGPFLAFGLIIAFLYGREILLIYYRVLY